MRNRSRFEEARPRSPAAKGADIKAETLDLSADDSLMFHPHRLEQDVRFRLMSEPRLNFESLVVRRVENGVCLEGVLETDDDSTAVSRLVRRVAGVDKVLNCLVLRRSHELPKKG